MRTTKFLILTICLSLNTVFAQINSVSDPGFPRLENLFFGQKPPGLSPEVIAPGIVTTDEAFIGSVKFSPDMKEIYTSKKGGQYKDFTHLIIRYEDSRWQDESVSDLKFPVFSKDGTILYKGNQYRERTESGWSEFKSMGAPFDDKLIMGISLSDKKAIFFSHFDTPDRDGVISYSRFIDGKYEPSQKLGKEINNGSPLAHPYIAPDESYLMWDAVREGGYGDSDLYISFRQNDGSWGAVINLGALINTKQEESSPRVTPDGKYLTFWRGGSRVKEDGSGEVFGSPYWVDVQIIETLRPKQ